MKLSIVVPCYNEENNVCEFYNRTVEMLVYANNVGDIEVIFVNDGSKDNTLSKLKSLTNRAECRVRVLSFSRNFGKEAAIYAGLSASEGEYTTIIDADLQQDPALVLDMLEVLEKDSKYDCVAMYQEKRKENKLLSVAKKMFYKTISKVSEIELYEGASDFRLFRRNVLEAMLSLCENERFTKGIFAWVGFNTYYMPYEVHERLTGTSKWSVMKLIKYALSGITSFTVAPLKLSTFVGVLTDIGAVVYLLVQAILAGLGKTTFSKYDVFVAGILFILGLQFICIGVIGRYLAKVYNEIKNRPVYILKEDLNNDEACKEAYSAKTVNMNKKKIS